MKKYIVLFILFCIAAILYLSFPLNSKRGFVSIKENKFILNGKEFYPLAVNYITYFRADKNKLWVSPYHGYTPDSITPCFSKDSCLMQLRADMELIKEMGFNSVRFVGVGEEIIDKKTGQLSINANLSNNRDTVLILSNEENYKKYFDALGGLFDAANSAGLKIVFLIRVLPEIKSTEDHLRLIATRFKNDTSLMAYDLFNEPLYFDSLERKKTDIPPITKRWKKIMRMYAPDQLSTIGLVGIREIFEWDPNLVDVDFLSFHPYEFEPEQVRNELYWYGQCVKKPWIIGETALPADNDSVTYEEQKKWAHNSLKQAYDCGASGYTWWQYKDVNWHAYRADWMGVVTRKGETKLIKYNAVVKGTPKPLVEEFKKFNPSAKKDSGILLPNYYNWSQHKKFRIIGHLLDENNNPIKEGVVLAWDKYWTHSYHTISKSDGNFELMGDFSFYHWIASATLYSMTRAEISPDTARAYKDSIPTINIGNVKLNKLALKN